MTDEKKAVLASFLPIGFELGLDTNGRHVGRPQLRPDPKVIDDLAAWIDAYAREFAAPEEEK